jgi:hypothetical protein
MCPFSNTMGNAVSRKVKRTVVHNPAYTLSFCCMDLSKIRTSGQNS